MADLETDVVVIGAGHNALVTAGYLAEAGLEVVVLEAREVIGGNTVTERLTLPAWEHDSCSSAHVVIQSNPLLRRDELGLVLRYGLDYIVTDPAVVMATDDHGLLVIPPDLRRAQAEVARFSARDAEALGQLVADWDAGLAAVHAHVSSGLTPPDGPWTERYRELAESSAWDVVRETFEHPAVRQTLLWLAFATIQPPERPGTGILPYAITTGRLRYGWTTPRGGSIALPRALEAHLKEHRSSVLTGAPVRDLLVRDGRCVGVRTADGREVLGRRAVVSSAHITQLPAMLGEHRSTMLDDAASTWRPGLAVFAVHLAVAGPVAFRSATGNEVRATAGGLGAPDGLRRQVAQALANGHTEEDDPWILVVNSTVVDRDRAPGDVVKFLTIAPSLLEGREWTEADADTFAKVLLEKVRRHTTGLDDAAVLARHVETPSTLAAHNPANVAGSCHGGEFHLADGSVLTGWPEHRTDVPGLYLTGSCTHPGGSVSGRPGRNTARVLLEDLQIAPSTVMSLP